MLPMHCDGTVSAASLAVDARIESVWRRRVNKNDSENTPCMCRNKFYLYIAPWRTRRQRQLYSVAPRWVEMKRELL